MRNLEGDLLVDPGVFGEVDAAEAAAAEGRQDAVLPDGLTPEEHEVECEEYSSAAISHSGLLTPEVLVETLSGERRAWTL